MARSFWDEDPFSNNNMDDIFNRFLSTNGQGNSGTKYYVNGHELTPEELAKYQEAKQGTQIPVNNQEPANSQQGILGKLGRNLTQEAKDGKLDPVIGREKEIQETAEILSRRTKNNPILVGDAGVGKTAVVEGLAQAIVKGDVPEAIKDKQIISVDLSSLEAGTQYRGSFEENVQNLIKEVEEAGNVVLFFDEIHQIIGAGASGGEDGSKGLADIIKPALSRGELSIIGATTQDEYRNTIMKDGALARRFNDVTINEPSKEASYQILKGLRSAYENHHHVKLPDDVLKAAVDYSVQYLPQRSLPDKAIDLMDMTAAHLAAKHPVTDKVTLEKDRKAAEADKEKAAQQEDFEKAASLKQKIEDIDKKLANGDVEPEETVATVNDIAESVQRLTGVPVSQMGTSDIERLKGMSKRLKSKVIGQDKAVDMVVRAIRRNRAGFDDGDRPIGSFLFVGPTGVGKTELVKRLAGDMFGNEHAIIRLDMSEYSDLTAVSKLIGTSAGYVGYEDNGNTLTEKVRRNPYSIVLLDEIEKANPQVLTLLLQVMDDGRLTDGQGNVVDFKNTIIIATSNAGFGNDTKKDEKLMDKLAPYFRPEFLNRFNGIVEFTHLTKKDLNQIVDLLLDDVEANLAKKGLTLSISKEAKSWLIDQGYDEAMGARPLRRVIEQQIRDKVAEFYLDNLDVKNLQADLVDGTIKISAATKQAA
ncbi:ATP-dependent Clp protease ATP-binding subunit [Companilactobacillus sp.]|jgi:ATP-dependent Clp protease ATP-binding subunit ClpL|uniref:ATP-dependent Clp protease ATP-binding subunit n=1 Tax=Companilactobacillus sp. TaxID=2767905 RepID=UPI0025B80365|nr:ATP-dependent Clp protease ATP-binding subunit [Companilactobacillus sp.]MCH4008663.1 ATP-dependent Clp protease ATP-binding subunit [Companilactobacillus sp.]MCH4051158.1 ATP-dependent Clp protease ATP-binding subunit [Companilactobacillus sp.]MCH4076606.1 ATP-dependent Clp protease ATP-binding subunit [Companilactobacillus sp.]MCH4125181.1 ATP-dependent Clp protease ATP-binding subunit [Companilactobacillus sp.]MCH4131721.1 ATP-dependent Clp protease ATP-binding subunit [Companilactobacil